MMAYVPHYEVGGTIHMIINNQVGFTTPGDRGRSTRYCTDLAKSIMAPVFHVNGDDPEALDCVTQLAFNYQQKFHKDVFIDLMCFRRWGHNELDDPTFTNPGIYKIIHSRKSVPDLYAERLLQENVVTPDDIQQCIASHTQYLNSELEKTKDYQPTPYYYQRSWQDIQPASSSITTWNTGVDYDILHYVGVQSVTYPEKFVSTLICFRWMSQNKSPLTTWKLRFADNSSACIENARQHSADEIEKWRTNRLGNSRGNGHR